MIPLRVISKVVATLLITAPVLDAQSLDSIRTGEVVKVWSRATGTEGVKVTWMGTSNDSVVMTIGKAKRELRIPRDSLWRLDVRNGNSKARGALYGAVPGAVAGGLSAWLISTASSFIFKDCADCEYGPIPSEKERWEQEDRDIAMKSATIGAGVGTLLGAYYGSRRLAPRWTRIALGNRVGVLRAHPARSGSGIALSISSRF